MGDFGLGFLKPPGEVAAEGVDFGVPDFFASAAGAFAFAAALPVVPPVAVDVLEGARVVLGAGALAASFGAAAFGVVDAGLDAAEALGGLGDFGGTGLLPLGAGLSFAAEGFAVGTVDDFLGEALLLAAGVPSGFCLLAAALGVSVVGASLIGVGGNTSVGGGRA